MIKKNKLFFLNKKIVFFIITLIFIFISLSGLLNTWENKAMDKMIVADYIFSKEKINKISIINIDQKTIKVLGGWPLPRSRYSKAINILNKNEAKIIGLDLIFSNYSSEKEDENLYNTFKNYNNIVLAMSADLRIKKNIFKKDIEIVSLNKAIKPFFKNTQSGHVNFLADSDGIIRKFTPYIYFNDKKYSAFSLKLALSSTTISENNKVKKNIQNKNLILNPPGPSQTIPHIPFHKLLNDNFDPKLIQDRIVLIGVTDPSLGDSYMTSFSRYGYQNGVELNAYALYNYLNNNYIKKSITVVNIITMFLLASSIFYFYNYLLKKNKLFFLSNFIVTILFAFIYLILHFTLFYKFNYYLELITPLLMIFTIYLIDFVYRYFDIEAEKQFIKDTFSRYISEEVMNELLKNPEIIESDGIKRELTILFVDIRSFSDYSESVSSKKAVNNLNYTFEKLTKIILKYNGTLDKYLGDGLLAFFGAPLDQKDHHQKAFKAASEIQKLSFEKNIPFKLGIGINSGKVIVGNIGSKDRLDYTVIGTAVNKASLFVDNAKSHEIIISQDFFSKLDKENKTRINKDNNFHIWEEIKHE